MGSESGGAQLDVSAIANMTTLFDTLSTDAMSIVVKRMNRRVEETIYRRVSPYDRPRYRSTRASEQVRFLALLFSENSPFRAAAATLVSRIELCCGWLSSYIDSSTKVLNIVPTLFNGEGKDIELCRNVFSACGPYVRNVSVNNVPKDRAMKRDFMEQFMAHVFLYCRNVEEVKFSEYEVPLTKWGIASSFFREYGGNLRAINWEGEEDENGLSDIEKCVNVRRLKSHKLNTSTLVSLLKASRTTLEEIDISIAPVGESVEVIEAIRNHCKKLSVITIRELRYVVDVVGQESYMTLIRSYGSQLKSAKTSALCREHLAELANACTNLEVTVRWENESSVDWRRLYDMGPRVVSLSLDAGLLHGDQYWRALDQCSNLRELYIAGIHGIGRQGVTDEMIVNVFSPSRFPKLEHLSIQCFEANERNMALLASCTGNLKSACFEWVLADSGVRGFKFIADSNRCLKDIKVVNAVHPFTVRSEESALKSLNELVNMFRKCRNLWFGISCWNGGEVKEEDLMRICKVLPCRDVDVFVGIGNLHFHVRREDSNRCGAP